MEARPYASICTSSVNAVIFVQWWATPGAVGLVTAISGMSLVPSVPPVAILDATKLTQSLMKSLATNRAPRSARRR